MKKNSKIRLLFVIHLPPPKHGVSIINAHVERIFRENEKFEIATIPIRPNKNLSNLKDVNIFKIFYSIKLTLTLFFKLIVFRPEKLYFTPTPKAPVFFRDIIIILIAKLFRVKVYLHFHRQGLKDLIEKNAFLAKVIRYTLKGSTLIHLTPYLVEQEFIATNLNKCANVLFIPNPLVLPPIIIDIPKKEDQLLFFSNLIPEKGILELIDAIPLVVKQKPDIRLIISGGVVSESYYFDIKKRIEKLCLKDYVSLIPNPSDDKKIKLFNESKVFVLPSNEDCFPLVILEALSYGMPVITTKVGGLNTIFPESSNNIFFGSNSPEDLSINICKFLNTKQNSTLIKTEKQIQAFNSNFENSLINILSN